MKKVIMAGLSTALLALAFTATAPSVAVPASATDVSDFNAVDHIDTSNYAVSDPKVYDDGLTALSGSGCTKSHRGYQVDAYNHFGNHIWSFGSYVQDCYKNGMVIHKNWGNCWGWTSTNVLNRWAFKGCEIETQGNQDVPRQYVWRQWRGHFKSCIYIAGCDTKDPYIYLGARGDGTFGVNGGL